MRMLEIDAGRAPTLASWGRASPSDAHDAAAFAVPRADPIAVLRHAGGRGLRALAARGGSIDRAGRISRARRAVRAVGDRRAGRQAEGAPAGRCGAGAAAAPAQPLLLSRARL